MLINNLKWYEQAFLQFKDFYDINSYINSNYERVEHLFSGNEVTVFVGYDKATQKKYVIKLGYGKAPMIPKHKNILIPRDIIQYRNIYCIISEYITPGFIHDKATLELHLSDVGIIPKDITNKNVGHSVDGYDKVIDYGSFYIDPLEEEYLKFCDVKRVHIPNIFTHRLWYNSLHTNRLVVSVRNIPYYTDINNLYNVLDSYVKLIDIRLIYEDVQNNKNLGFGFCEISYTSLHNVPKTLEYENRLLQLIPSLQ